VVDGYDDDPYDHQGGTPLISPISKVYVRISNSNPRFKLKAVF
jgi:hypothetical protein